MTRGFSLFEILLSMMILAGTVASLIDGFTAAEKLEFYSRFETQAAFFAERELEMLKTDLLRNQRPAGPAGSKGRFRLPSGWQSHLVWTNQDDDGVVRLVSSVSRASDTFRCESFCYLPPETLSSGTARSHQAGKTAR